MTTKATWPWVVASYLRHTYGESDPRSSSGKNRRRTSSSGPVRVAGTRTRSRAARSAGPRTAGRDSPARPRAARPGWSRCGRGRRTTACRPAAPTPCGSSCSERGSRCPATSGGLNQGTGGASRHWATTSRRAGHIGVATQCSRPGSSRCAPGRSWRRRRGRVIDAAPAEGPPDCSSDGSKLRHQPAHAVEVDGCALGVVRRLRADLQHEPVGSSGDRGARHRGDCGGMRRGLRGVGDQRAGGSALDQRDGVDLEPRTLQGREGADARLAEDHLSVPVHEDVLGGEQELFDRGADASAQDDRPIVRPISRSRLKSCMLPLPTCRTSASSTADCDLARLHHLDADAPGRCHGRSRVAGAAHPMVRPPTLARSCRASTGRRGRRCSRPRAACGARWCSRVSLADAQRELAMMPSADSAAEGGTRRQFASRHPRSGTRTATSRSNSCRLASRYGDETWTSRRTGGSSANWSVSTGRMPSPSRGIAAHPSPRVTCGPDSALPAADRAPRRARTPWLRGRAPARRGPQRPPTPTSPWPSPWLARDS